MFDGNNTTCASKNYKSGKISLSQSRAYKIPVKSPPQLPDSLRKQAVDWLFLIQSEHCTDQDRQALAAWLAQTPLHRHAYETLQAQWQLLKPLKNKHFPARKAALRYRAKLQHPLRAYSAAAALLLALGLTAFNSNGWLGISQTYIAQKGDRQTITLADNTLLELNTDSEVRVHYDYWRRKIEVVRGEAFFTVTHDAARPFEVRAGNGRIRDLGTAFDVYRKTNRTLVAVQEGLVEVQAQNALELHAGQQLSYNEDGEFLKEQDQDPLNLTAWRKGQLVFHNSRLADVLLEISRYHDRLISMKDPSLAELRVSGVFYTDKLTDLLNAISAILPVKVEYLGNREILLKPAGAGSKPKV